MDPVTLIVAALGAGASVVANAAVGEAVKDAYDALKSRIVAHFKGKSEHEAALAAFEKDPDGGAKALAAAITESQADKDPDVVDASHALLDKALPDGASRRQYVNKIQGNVYGLVQGDHNELTFNFGPPETKQP